jgi:hypothetical protein
MQVRPHPQTIQHEEYELREGALRELSREFTDVAPKYVPPLALSEAEITSRVPKTMHGVVKMLVEGVIEEVVAPALRAPTRADWTKFVRGHWHEFHETVSTLHVILARASSEERAALTADSLAHERIAALERAARTVSGRRAAGEARFCGETYLRAVRLIPRVTAAQGLTEPEMVREDRRHAFAFASAASMHVFGVVSVLIAATDAASATPSGLQGAFDLLRVGALDAYAAVRGAIDLRYGDPDDAYADEPTATDDEDRLLASIDDE